MKLSMEQPSFHQLNDYFFNKCDKKSASEIEKWFYQHGNTEEADRLLFLVWEEIQLNIDNKEEASTAFKIFRQKLENQGEIPGKKSINWKKYMSLIQRVAAILILPVFLLFGYQFYKNKEKQGLVWIEKHISFGEKGEITLPDGTEVWLNSGSKIIYPEKFTGKYRQVFLSGEGYFRVAKDASHKFMLQINQANIEVLGTVFNVKSYTEDNILDLSLLEGSIAFSDMSGNTPPYILIPGEKIQYDLITRDIIKDKFVVDNYSSWKDGHFYFKNEELAEITKQLERHFNVRIIIQNDSLKTLTYYMAFVNNENLDEILNAMNKHGQMKIKRSHDIIEIY